MGVMSLLWSLAAVLMITTVSAGDETALLAFKGQISSSGSRMLASWNSSADFCTWEGVTCSHQRPARVMALSLNGSALIGALSPALGNLTFLRTLNLSFNGIQGEIPASLGRLRRLQILDLSYNSFSGTFPMNLSSCISMTALVLDSNKLSGRIPAELGETLTSLVVISLKNNSFTELIPASLANMSRLGDNQLVGSIPPELGSIESMSQLYIYYNNLSEYGEGSAASTHSDIYSLGILLLEMFTGRSPTDDTFRGSLDLHKFAVNALPDRTLEIVDPTIWLHREAQDNAASSIIQKCLVSVFRLGISCSQQQPREQALIGDAAVEMHAIRDAYLLFAG